jgi:Tfp pilus assembly protein PilF
MTGEGETWLDRRAGQAVTLGLLVLVAYHPVLTAGFVYDDLIIVKGNPTIDSLSPASVAAIFQQNYWYPHLEVDNLYRPVTVLTHAIEHAIAGESPWLYHLTNLLLHLVNVLLLAAILRRLWPRAGWRAVLPAGIFAVHPVLSEAVSNVTCRADVLMVTLVLAAGMLIDHRHRRWLIPLLALAALFTKENGIVLLPVVFLIDGAMRRDGEGRFERWRAAFGAHRTAYLGGVVMVLAGLAIRAAVLGRSTPTTVITPPELNILAYTDAAVRIMTGIKLIGLSAAKFAWPFPLSFDYGTSTIAPVETPWNPGLLLSIAFWSAALWWGWRNLKRRPQLAAAILICLGCLLPVSNILFPITSIFNERFLYLPAIGVAMVLGFLTVGTSGERLRVASFAVVIIIAALATWQRTHDWRTVDSIIEATAEASPRSANALMDLAGLRAAQGDAVAEGRLLRQAVDAFPDSPRAHFALGLWYQRNDDWNAAVKHFRASLTDRPTSVSLKSAMKLGYLHATAGQNDAAIAYYRHALTINPHEAGAHYGLALLLRGRDDRQSERHARRAAQLGRPVPSAP